MFLNNLKGEIKFSKESGVKNLSENLKKLKIFIFVLILISGKNFISNACAEFYITAGTMFHFMYHNEEEISTLPVNFSLGIGGMAFSDKKICLDFAGTISMNYFDYTSSGKTVYTEIENRTARGYGLMADCTARYNKIIGDHRFTVGGGLGFLGRFATKADTIPEDEEWKIGKINSSFWNLEELFYPTLAFSWLYHASSQIQAGLEMKTFIGFKELKLSLSLKLALGQCSRVYKAQEESLEVKSDSASVGGESL